MLAGNKCLGGIWVVGYLCDENYINPVEKDAHETSIDPATIGQCTGVPDKNGTLIFDGDIGMDRYGRKFLIKDSVELCSVRMFVIGGTHEYALTKLEASNLEIIGNIHDNPELLEVEA